MKSLNEASNSNANKVMWFILNKVLTVEVFIDSVLTYVLDRKNAHSTSEQTNTNVIFILAHALKLLRHMFLSFSKVIYIISHIKLTSERKF